MAVWLLTIAVVASMLAHWLTLGLIRRLQARVDNLEGRPRPRPPVTSRVPVLPVPPPPPPTGWYRDVAKTEPPANS